MNLFDSIDRRKSCRQYLDEPLSKELLNEIEGVLESFPLLFPQAPLSYRFTDKTKGMFHVQAPHYLVIGGLGKEGEQENAGFVGQQLTLWFNSRGLGSVWLGASRDATATRQAFDLIIIAFGQVEGSPNRAIDQFKRKEMTEITNASDDNLIEAVRLAPSGMNIQPWFIEKTENQYHFYRQILKAPLSFAYKLTKIDMGIALCHFTLACQNRGKDYSFNTKVEAETKKGYDFFASVEILN
ncbi:MAG: hypothetical protein GX138_03730 [Firmicutes bacterium]|jgi:nitroreductase|nr:hypothetical protein [Bacillota bacterium]